MDTVKKAWRLLDRRSQSDAVVVLLVSIVGAQAAALIVGSVLPFLTVLSDPARIEDVAALGRARDVLNLSSDYHLLVALGIGSVCIIIMANIVQLLRIYFMMRFVNRQKFLLSSRLLENYLLHSYEYFLNRHSGDMNTSVLSEVDIVVDKFYLPATSIVASSLTVISILGLLIWLQPFVAMLAMGVFGGIYAIATLISRRRLSVLGAQRSQANTERYRISGEALAGIKEIKLLGRERAYMDRFHRPAQTLARAGESAALIGAMPQYVIQMVAFGGVIVFCLLLISPEQFASGDALGSIVPILGVFAFAGQRLMPELGAIYLGMTNLRFAGAAIDLLHADLCLDKTTQVQSGEARGPIVTFERTLELKGITYRYPGSSDAGVSDITLTIRAGERIGIVGETGAGKTTLVDLVLGLLEPTSGEIRVDGMPLRSASIRGWQRRVAYVPQEIFLIDASVSENIALGVPSEEIDEDRVVRSSEVAQLHRFVQEELPRAYGTVVGERGVRLSGGQRQRIGIARALYRDAEVIIFDEATSALDNLTEREVMAAIDALPGDKTVLMIAHRLSTVRGCDQIVVLERGRVVGVGIWESLMAENGTFRAMTRVA